ncbi:MAG TPA: protein-glutamate O-methyltransferase [Smithellaceae bacterium]|nr:protein-glutamate O-methyltransferase [Smithellaceae bacterium]HQM45123.1 protein-glutamate O-methyltransferase [Smithellaceae bacterium]
MSVGTFELKNSDFDKISRLVYEQCGIYLHEGKKELVKARLGKRLRAGNYKSFTDYYNYVTTEEGTEELISMIDSISTNLTSFFREESHFARLRHIILSSDDKPGSRSCRNTFRIWSAGCSTGEEPYTLAITFAETVGYMPLDVSILATDISTKVLKIAESGIYAHERTKGIAQPLLKKYFQIGTGKSAGYVRIKNDLKKLITFQRFNLMERFPAQNHFDTIFCRNVMIYFDKQTQNVLVNKFYDSLKSGGYFFVGHSESLTGLKHHFNYVEPSVYRKS